ncbi:hypothetical protein KCP69_25330 [Salmonella enterica subsp. enterica]|nr:hypothetical protein KCP69_25330 [Salmonella enterica subsp. enterica]
MTLISMRCVFENHLPAPAVLNFVAQFNRPDLLTEMAASNGLPPAPSAFMPPVFAR